MKYDVGIIGAGVAGLTAALEAKSLGYKVVLFEKINLGGLSFNGGEIIIRKFFDIIKDFKIVDTKYNLDIDKTLHLITEYKNKSIDNYLKLFKGVNQVDVVYGEGELINQNELVINGKTYYFDKLILAYGSKTRVPKIKGAKEALESKFIVKAHNLLEIHKNVSEIAILGSGRVAFEVAVIFSMFGIKAYVLARNGFMNHLDDDIKDLYLNAILNDNIVLIDKTELLEIKDNELIFNENGVRRSLILDNIVLAMGYMTNTEPVKNLNIDFDRNGIITNKYLETSIPGVYAIGDCNNKPRFSNLAVAEGLAAASHINGKQFSFDYDRFIMSVFGLTNYAYVGKNEKELQALGIPYFVKTIKPKEDITNDLSLDFIKIIFHRYTNEFLGMTIIGESVIHEMNAILMAIDNSSQFSYQNSFPTFSNARYVGQAINNYFKVHNIDLIDNHLESFYQPKYETKTNKIIGAESLARFLIDEKYQFPLPLIESFEKNNMIIHLDLKVIENAAKLIKELSALNLLNDDFKISVNISPQTLSIVNLDVVDQILNKYDVSKNHMIFEITERDSEKINLVKVIENFKERGYFISIDDFSIGNSSLPLIKKLNVNEVKIDRSLLPEETNDEFNVNIFESVVKILESLNVQIVAEGVETKEQLEMLKTLNVHSSQGYYLKKPISKEELIVEIKNNINL